MANQHCCDNGGMYHYQVRTSPSYGNHRYSSTTDRTFLDKYEYASYLERITVMYHEFHKIKNGWVTSVPTHFFVLLFRISTY
jgi:hypothetical protein